jgi:hypothetical protein
MGALMGLGFISGFSDVMSTMYSIGYSTLNFSKPFTIQGGKVKLFEGIRVIVQGGRGAPLYLFRVSINCPK